VSFEFRALRNDRTFSAMSTMSWGAGVGTAVGAGTAVGTAVGSGAGAAAGAQALTTMDRTRSRVTAKTDFTVLLLELIFFSDAGRT
jgi:hypothetical protein